MTETDADAATNPEAATDALEALGLRSYEAQVFVALQKLGVGSASEIDEIAAVPRSQVYGAADNLEERGLLEIQQSNPIRYRPVELGEARERLRSRYEQREQQAFERLDEIRATQPDGDEQKEAVWTIHGRDSIVSRTTQLIRDSEHEILYGGGPDLLEDDVAAALSEQAGTGVSVTVVSGAETVLDAFDHEQTELCACSTDQTPEDKQTGRILVVDGETVLLSVPSEDGFADQHTETAIWSAHTSFAAVIVQLIDAWLDEQTGR